MDLTEDGGLKKRLIKEGHGECPPVNSKVKVHYVGTLLNGEKFDSSRDRGDLFEFTLGKGQVIKGWDLGVATMKIGEVSELICEAGYAYGERGSPPKIPPNATLKFEVELFDFEEDPEDAKGKIRLAAVQKEKGNASFKEQQFEQAVRHYEKGAKLVNDTWTAESEEVKKEMESLKCALNGNLAMACIKVKKFKEAASAVKTALVLDAGNAKLLYRLGVALNGLGEYDDSLKQLELANEKAPQDEAIKQEITLVKRSKKAFLDKEKQMYANMFK